MFRRPGLWLVHCNRCGAWFGLRGHTVRDCYTRLPYREELRRVGLRRNRMQDALQEEADTIRRIGKDKHDGE